VLAAGCAWNVSPAQLLAQCVQDCESQHTLIPVDCLSTWATAMACASCGAVQCPRQTCVQDGSVCIAEGLQVSGCDDSANALKACAGACTASSLVEGASLPEGSFETKTTGCVCPAALRPGRAAGEACQSSSDCAEICCGLPGGAAPGPRRGRSLPVVVRLRRGLLRLLEQPRPFRHPGLQGRTLPRRPRHLHRLDRHGAVRRVLSRAPA
jgi:hypothetical protein